MFHNDCEGIIKSDLAIMPIGHLSEKKIEKYSKFLKSNFFYGFDYTIINEEILNYEKDLSSKNEEYLSVTMGGSDPFNILPKIIKLLKKINFKYPIKLLVGDLDGFDREKMEKLIGSKHINFSLHKFNYKILFNSHLIISAFGVTTYECIFKNIPIISVPYNSKSLENSLFLAKNTKTIEVLPSLEEKNFANLENKINILWDGKARNKMISHQKNKIDGKGLNRVSELILKQV